MNEESPKTKQKWLFMGTLATQAVLAPVVGTVVGMGVDGKFNTSPWGLCIGLLLGLAVSIHLFRYLLRKMESDE